MIHSVLQTIDLNSGEQVDYCRVMNEKDSEKTIKRFLTRMQQDRQNSPTRSIKPYQIFSNGKMETLE